MTRGNVRNRRQVFIALLLGCGLWSGAQAASLDKQVDFHIPPQQLSSGLIQFSDQADIQVVSQSPAISSSRTNGVSGRMSARAGLEQLLEGTGLIYTEVGDKTVAIRNESVTEPAASPATTDRRVRTAEADSPRPAVAQSAAEQRQAARDRAQSLGEVTITGSRIKRPGYDTLEATSVTRAQQIENRGYTNALQALQATPGFGAPGSSPVSDSQARLGIGQSFANYFGLGSQRTLTLVNGRRFVSSNSAAGGNAAPGSQVDLNLIPVGLIDRIETIAIGGAPVYGADAIAGTVNIILKDHFQGIKATVQHGISDQGDAKSNMFSVLMGGNFDNGRGNAVISAEHVQQDSLVFGDRYSLIYALPNPKDTGPDDGIPAVIFAPNVHLDFFTEGGLPYNGSVLDIAGLHYPGLYPNGNYLFNSSGQPLQFGPNGELVPIDFGDIVNSANLGGGASVPLYSTGGQGVDASRHFGLLTESKRTLLNGIAHYDLSYNLRAFVNTSYAHTEGILPSDLSSIVSPNLVNSPSLSFSVDNPFLSDQARKIVKANGLTQFNLARNFNDLVDRTPPTLAQDVYRIVTGLDGKFDVFGETWSWNAAYNYGRSRSTSKLTYVNPDRLLLAADAVRGPSGDIVCASGGDCVPIDLFGENAFSAAAADYVTDHGIGISTNTMKDWVANIGGPLPFGIATAQPVKFNLGYERRTESAEFEPDAVLKTGGSLDGIPGYTAISGEYTTNEIYGEALVPVVSDQDGLSWLKSASFDLAARNVDNSIAGSDVTWSAGGRIAPRFSGWANGLTFRGVYTHAIRAPSVTELFLPSSGALNAVTDPCDAGNYKSGPVPEVRAANCKAALAAVGAPPPAQFHSTTRPISVPGTRAGNPDLENETADSWSVGVVYQPVEFPHFRLSADWSHISLENGIELLGINDILSACYDSTSYPNDACGKFSRLTPAQASSPRTAGDIADGYRQGYINSSSLEFSGLIMAAQYNSPLSDIVSSWKDAGRINVKGTVFYRNRYDVVNFAGQPAVEAAGTIGLPEYQARLNLGYRYHGFNTAWQILWNSSVVISNTATIEDYPDYSIPSYTLVSATFGYQLNDNLRLQLVINNVFDKKLPVVAIEERAFGTYDPLGRAYLLRLTADVF